MTQYSAQNLPPSIQQWKNAIEEGSSPEAIATSCYQEGAILKGTVWSKAVQGHADIISYFEHFTEGKNNAKVNFTTLSQSPSGSFAGEYVFEWQDNNDQPQSAHANYTFEPNTDGSKISLHHSSFFVEGTS